jgi:hypothetical protein
MAQGDRIQMTIEEILKEVEARNLSFSLQYNPESKQKWSCGIYGTMYNRVLIYDYSAAEAATRTWKIFKQKAFPHEEQERLDFAAPLRIA